MWCMLIWGGLGFLAGWIVFKRPEWATELIGKVRAKLSW